NGDIISVKGRSDVFLKLTVIKKIFDTIGIIATIPFGIWALVWFQVVSALFKLGLNCYFAGKFLKYTLWRQIVELFSPIIGLAIGVALLLWCFNHYAAELPDIARLVLGFSGGIGIFFYMAKLLRFDAYSEFVQIVYKLK